MLTDQVDISRGNLIAIGVARRIGIRWGWTKQSNLYRTRIGEQWSTWLHIRMHKGCAIDFIQDAYDLVAHRCYIFAMLGISGSIR